MQEQRQQNGPSASCRKCGEGKDGVAHNCMEAMRLKLRKELYEVVDQRIQRMLQEMPGAAQGGNLGAGQGTADLNSTMAEHIQD